MAQRHDFKKASAPVADGGGVVAGLAQLRGEGLGDLLGLFDLRSTRIHLPKAMLVRVE